MVSKASDDKGTRLTRRLRVAGSAPGKGAGAEAILVCAEAIVLCGLSRIQIAVALVWINDFVAVCCKCKAMLRSKFMPHLATQNPYRIARVRIFTHLRDLALH